MPEPKPTVLLVEDNDEDAFLLQRALRMDKIECELHVATDGQEALDYLGATGRFADRTRFAAPCLMVLDLKLPFVSGFEVLAWLAQQPTWKDLRVIILTSSGEDRDRARAEQFGIQSYFVKPPGREFTAVLAKALQEICAGTSK